MNHLVDFATKELDVTSAEPRTAIAVSPIEDRDFFPSSLEPGEVSLALRTLAAQISDTGALTVTCDTHEWDFRTLSADTVQHIYAIAQQVLSNAIEHPEIKTVALALRADAQHLILVISHPAFVSNAAREDADTRCSRVIADRIQILRGTLSDERLTSGSRRIGLRCPARHR